VRLPVHGASPRGYDARAHGALCDQCLLNGRPKVPPELRSTSDVLIVGEAPGTDDVKQCQLFVGWAGRELMVALAPYAAREDLSFTNACLCQPEHNDMDAVRRETKKQVKLGRALLDPVVACHGRLQAELLQYPNLIPLGSLALEAITGRATAITALRGRPFVREPHKMLPAMAPYAVLKQTRWRHVFRGDIARAFRLFSGALSWEAPSVALSPSVDLLEQWLAKASRDRVTLVLDIETDGIEALTTKLRCLGIAWLRTDGTVRQTVVVGFRRIQGERGPYSARERPRVVRAVRAMLTDPRILKVGHNFGYFDAAVLDRVFHCVTAPYEDTILLHRAVESELPHSLGFIGSAYTDVQAWKDVRGALDYESDDDLQRYCATDVAVTGVVYPALRAGVALRQQQAVVEMDHRVQRFCRDMHEVGMFVDQEELARHRAALEWTKAHELRIIREGTERLWGQREFNPGSTIQVADLVFGTWGVFCRKEWLTDGGSPSTDTETIRALMREPGMSQSQLKFLDHLRRYRRAVKFLGTFVTPIVEMLAAGQTRIHPQWNAHVTVSGRLSSSNPNAQQFPYKMRSMFAAAPGNILIGCDMDQIELRLAAAVAGAGRYLEVFRAHGDPHALTSLQIYGDAWTQAKESDAAAAKKLRDFAKRFSYACLYGAEDKTVYEVLTSVEDNNGDYPYLGLAMQQTSQQRAKWLNGNPEFRQWWARTVAEWRRDTFLADKVIGRRRDFLDGENKNEQVNFPIQAASAAIVHLNTFDLIDAGVHPGFDGPGTGIIQQGHDALLVECSEARGEEIQTLVQAAMNRRVPAYDVDFTSAAKRGKRWTGT
jgi:uracil-DNA glycosylase family 4